MAQMIDTNGAKTFVMGNYPNDPLLKHIAITLLDQLPKAEAVEVVRCKDCKFGEMCSIREVMALTDPNGYCCRGERRTNEQT